RLPETTRPDESKATPVTSSSWPVRTRARAGLAASIRRMVRSAPHEAIHLPSGEKATPSTDEAWPLIVRTHSPDSTFQSRTKVSLLAVASVWPSGLKANALTGASLDRRNVGAPPKSPVHNQTPAPCASASVEPPADQARSVMKPQRTRAIS